MGFLKAAVGAVGGVFADQWKEYFYCEALPVDVLAVKGNKKTSKRSSNRKGEDNIISNGSVIAVSEGQCAMVVEQGRVVDVCAEPGEFIYDVSSEPSLFFGDLSDSMEEVFQNVGRRFQFGGTAANDQRVYYFNTKEITGNKYGTPNPVPFRVVDHNIGLDMDISIRCFGEYSYRMINPVLFYTNVCGNFEGAFMRKELENQMRTELMTALQPAFARISEMGIRYSALPGHTMELANVLNELLSQKWRELRGIEIVSFGVSSVKASEEDERMLKELQKNAVYRNPNMAAAQLAGAQAAAMQDAARNSNGAAMGFMGMNMAANAGGMNAQDLFRMGQQMDGQSPNTGYGQSPNAGYGQSPNAGYGQSPNAGYGQAGGAVNGAGAAAGTWVCGSCGTSNDGNFCTNCGAKRPSAAVYKCSRCGWVPPDPTRPPKFCPQCGDPFDGQDRQ